MRIAMGMSSDATIGTGVLTFEIELHALPCQVEAALRDVGTHVSNELRTIALAELLNECRDKVTNSRRLLADDVFDQLVGERGHARAVRVQDLVIDPGGERLDSGSGNGGDVFPDRIDKRLHIRHVGLPRASVLGVCCGYLICGTGMTTSPTLTCASTGMSTLRRSLPFF